MQYPDFKRHQILAPNTELDWNKLGVRDFVVVSKDVNGSVRHFFGQVDWVEKLRNCHMLHIDVWECWSDGADGYEFNDTQLNEFATGVRGSDVPCKSKWKKPKGAVVRAWDPNNQRGYIPQTHTSRLNRYGSAPRKMPSDRTAEAVGTPTGSDLDEKLRSRAGKRQAYVAARALMTVFRGELEESLTMLGMTLESTPEEFKRTQRTVMKQWHPDREAVYVASGGKLAEFKRESTRWMAALAKVKNSLFAVTHAAQSEA